jgi:hypothetical protein
MQLARALSVARLARLVAVTVALTLPLHQTIAQGPVKAAAPRTPHPIYFMLACKHDDVFQPSMIDCGDTSRVTLFDGHEILRAQITVTLSTGKTFTQELGRGMDAVFLSDMALEKFAMPYYKENDRKTAERLQSFIARLKKGATRRDTNPEPRKR